MNKNPYPEDQIAEAAARGSKLVCRWIEHPVTRQQTVTIDRPYLVFAPIPLIPEVENSL